MKYHSAFAGEPGALKRSEREFRASRRSFSAPTYFPRNFRVLRMLDSTTIEFGWDPPLPSDDVKIRGVLKGYQVNSPPRRDRGSSD